MKQVYNLEAQIHDKLGRVKKTWHVGVYGNLELLEKAKVQTSQSNPGVNFQVYICEHILFEQQPA
jgi:hypothetical protein